MSKKNRSSHSDLTGVSTTSEAVTENPVTEMVEKVGIEEQMVTEEHIETATNEASESPFEAPATTEPAPVQVAAEPKEEEKPLPRLRDLQGSKSQTEYVAFLNTAKVKGDIIAPKVLSFVQHLTIRSDSKPFREGWLAAEKGQLCIIPAKGKGSYESGYLSFQVAKLLEMAK
jgi:hypothetical protein